MCIHLYLANGQNECLSQKQLPSRWPSRSISHPSKYLELTHPGQTILITGGSQGMGKSVAQQLARKGANVMIAARTIKKLEAALEDIKACAKRPSQRFHYISADLTNPSEAVRLISETTKWNNKTPPDIVWCCAGSSCPTLFIDTPVERLKEQMDSNYFSSAYVAHAVLRSWLKPSSAEKQAPSPSDLPRHIIFTSSVVAFYPIVGYSPYSPSKSAIRTLSDTLSQELHLYPSPGVKVHTVFPATIFGEAFDEENRVKPNITKKLEEEDGGQTADQVAEASLKGLEKGDELITTNGLLGMAMKGGMLGASRRNGWGVVDTLVAWVVAIVIVVVRRDMDGKVKKWGGVYRDGGIDRI